MLSLSPDSLPFPRPLSSYPPPSAEGLLATFAERVQIEPFNAIATAIFFCAIVHTFTSARFAKMAHDWQHRDDVRAAAAGQPTRPSVVAEILHFLGEVEVVFGLWAVALAIAMLAWFGWETTTHYLNSGVNYTEPMFVVVIMTLASTRPIIAFAEGALRKLAGLGGGTPAAWWVTILTVGPLLGSFITEPAAMTICALILARQFFDLEPSPRLRYATLGLLFVNVSIGGTLTHFAAPPVLMVARTWEWDTPFMISHFGWRSAVAIVVSTLIYLLAFRRELTALSDRPPVPEVERPDDESAAETLLPLRAFVTVSHMLFMVWTVVTAHYPALFVGGFLFFLGFVKATSPYQSRVDLRAPLLVGFFLAGLVVHGGLQAWWIGPALNGLSAVPLFFGATLLTAFNDNALITNLATLVPNLEDALKIAVVGGAVAGGGLTVVANAPNPAGQALLSRFFGGAVSPIGLFLGAIIPTCIAIVALLAL
jgi:hypothetical protein